MEFLKEIAAAVSGATLSLPAIEVTSLIILLAVCLIFKFTKTGLLASYIFTYRWGWIFFSDHQQSMLTGYLIFGMIVGILTAIQMMREPTQ